MAATRPALTPSSDGKHYGLNQFSGRFTELLAMGLIYRLDLERREGCGIYRRL